MPTGKGRFADIDSGTGNIRKEIKMAKWESTGVFQGMKVLDFTIALAGVYTAWQFADLGAEVW